MAALEVLLSGQNVPRLLHGLWLTLYISVISVAASALLGTGLGLLMRSGSAAVRAGCRLYLETLSSLPPHQRTSALALGLTRAQVFRYVEAPQALRRVLPGAINLFTRMVKTTSLAALISVMEVVKVGQQIIERSQMIEPKVPTASFWIYGLIFLLYFLVCWPLSWWAARLERRWAA